MSVVVGLHGILYDYLGEESSAAAWLPALRDGLCRANYDQSDRVDLKVAFYGDLFRQAGMKSSIPNLDVTDLDPVESELLLTLAELPPADADVKARAPGSLQAALRLLLGRKFFAALAGRHGERALLFGLRQVRLYLHDESIRAKVQDRFDSTVTDDTRVVVAHSLGSIVAYECLCTGRYPQVQAFVSLGSPLGMPRIVFDCLSPLPCNKIGACPSVNAWINVVDEGDLVALVKKLRPLFGTGAQVDDFLVYNGWQSHNVLHYLSAKETGTGIARGL